MATKKVRKFAVGGAAERAEREAARSQDARQAARGAVMADRSKLMAERDPERTFRQGISAAYSAAREVGNQYAPGSAERQNFRNYYRSLPKNGAVYEQGVAAKNYTVPTLAAFDPSKTYAAPVRGANAGKPPAAMAAPAATPAAAPAGGAGQAPRALKKGGMVSSGTKRGAGAAKRGVKKCKTY